MGVDGPGWAAAHTHVGWAIVVALASAVCYAVAAVVQQREAEGHRVGGLRLLADLAARPWWWATVAGSGAGGLLHVLALALGPLTLVQPLGVFTLVFALPLGARWGGREVTRVQWGAAAAVVGGLVALLSLSPHRQVRVHHLSLGVVCLVAAVTAMVVVVLLVWARYLPRGGGSVARAAAAAICVGYASAMVRVALTAAAAPLSTMVFVGVGAASGLALTQLAYRDGGLGAPLATLILIDPLAAGVLAITVIGEPITITLPVVLIGCAGLIATTVGIAVLTREPSPARDQPTHVTLTTTTQRCSSRMR